MPASTPIVGFHFSVIFELLPQFSIDTAFQSVSGLKETMGMEPYKEGGQNQFTHQLPVRAEYPDMVLKRPLSPDISGVAAWCRNAIEGFNFSPANLVVSLLDEQGNPVKAWYIVHAIPQSIDYGDFNAEENKLVIESITLKYNFFREIPIPAL
jgi:phage tail-like protein